jgi:DNA-binding CsgD family transcriptional regulator
MTRLTPRERQIALAAGEGKGPKQIASELNISPNTVKVYSSRLYAKLRVDGRAGLAAFAFRSGLANPPQVSPFDQLCTILATHAFTADELRQAMLLLMNPPPFTSPPLSNDQPKAA